MGSRGGIFLIPPLHLKETDMKVKRFIAALAVIVLVLVVASPALATSLGISPSHTELEVPGDGSATANFKVHYFSGDIQVSLVDIPLKVEPETIHVEALSEPVDIELTIYGDESLGSQVYDGYVRFIGMSGGAVAAGVEVNAKVTNIVEGQALPEEVTPEETPAPQPTPSAPPTQPPAPPAPQAEAEGFPIIPVVGIAAGAAIVITLIVFARKRRF